MKVAILTIVIFLSFACSEPTREANFSQYRIADPTPNSNKAKDPATVMEISCPSGYQKLKVEENTFMDYLRKLPLKPNGSLVNYYNGSIKQNNGIYSYVIKLPIGNKNLHQCADAIIRLKAEHLWQQKKYDEIKFNFTNGFTVEYSEWMKGRRMIVEGNKTYWDQGTAASNNYEDFWEYLELIFTYAGTASLEKELKKKKIDQADIGDVLIRGGHPGHAVIIVDKAIHEKTGKQIYLLAQSYMPAQEIQILNNPVNTNLSPWYSFENEEIATPEWIFTLSELKTF